MRIPQILVAGCLLLVAASGAPAPEPVPQPNPEPAPAPQPKPEAESPKIAISPEQKQALLKDLQNEIMRAYSLRALAEGIRVEQEAEDKMIESAVDAFEKGGLPMASNKLLEVEKMLKRDRRGVQALSGLLSSGGGSSGSGGHESNEVGGGAYGEAGGQVSAGSDSGSILGLIGPLLGSSSGGGGGGGDAGEEGGGSDSGSILSLVGPLLGSSSGGGSGGGGGGGSDEGGSDGGGSASAGSDSGSILGLVGPLLGSSSGSSSGGDGNSAGGGGGGSDSGSILGLIGPLLTSSSSGSSSSSGGGGGEGGSGLGSILGISKSSKHHDGTIDENGTVHGGGIISSITGAKLALVNDKIQLLLRLKFGLLTKILNKITTVIAKASLPPEGFELKYPDQYPSKLNKFLTGAGDN